MLAAKPYFLLPLDHKHLDEGTETTWRCLAYGKPTPQYSWYKNGVMLDPLATGNNIQVSNYSVGKGQCRLCYHQTLQKYILRVGMAQFFHLKQWFSVVDDYSVFRNAYCNFHDACVAVF